MSEAFAGTFTVVNDTACASPSPQDYADWVRESLASAAPGQPGILRIRKPHPTAAFSPQDRAHPRYLHVANAMRERGFEPIERGTGGRLTVFDESALGITIIAPHPDPHRFMMQRYEIFSAAIAKGLGAIGINARVGELPNEYCPGKFSINADGRIKLVGIAQRMTKSAYQMGAVVAVERSDTACAAIAEAYDAMDLAFDPQTYGAINDLIVTRQYSDVAAAIQASVQQMLR
jgi:octanoyl-[GcvH]:protein N-octanoyltransferase